MAQQINLLTPILLAPRRHFSALAMLQALAVLVLGTLLLSLWMQHQAQTARTQHAAVVSQAEQERRGLTQALTRLPQSADPKQLEQQLTQLEAQNAMLAQQIQALRSGLKPLGQRYSDLLLLLQRSIPEPVWLEQLSWQSGRLELLGGTLDPLPLRHWVAQLSLRPELGPLQIQQVQLEKLGALTLPPLAPDASGRATASPARSALSGIPAQAPGHWQFDIVLASQAAGAARAASGSAR